MSSLELEISSELGVVWRVGYEPDLWRWPDWQYATDSGLFNGRWDDQVGEFRTLYTCQSLLGCFLELLAHFRPSAAVLTGLAEIENDDGSVEEHDEAADGAVGYSWLDGRAYGSAQQAGRYCFITHSRTVAALQQHYPFQRHGIALADVDTALLKDVRDRVLTRSIARWLYDLRDQDRSELVDGVEFRSRHGDDICVWAVFERAGDEPRSRLIEPVEPAQRLTDETPELLEAFSRFGLHWHERDDDS
ncbi:RES domain-containing protein [Agromyces sp. NPDC058484]|uniref:RES domain-containing protein n=1 Tax=Agromyces sp. NPDC058484 TaxID=3346524 RepID=UPI003658CB33